MRLKKYLFIGLAAVLLTGCKSMAGMLVTEVKIPVLVPCKIVPPDKPVFPLQEAKKEEMDIFVILQKSLAEIELRQGYETKLEAAILECNK